MKQLEFESQNSSFWLELESLLDEPKRITAEQSKAFPKQYRLLCQHLAIAKSRGYAVNLVSRLNDLVKRGYQTLYGSQNASRQNILQFLAYGFPAALRSNGVYIWVAAAVFVLPYIAYLIGCWMNDQLLYSIMDSTSVRMMETMYEPGLDKFGRERQADSDILMFGHYISNNIGIAFRCFVVLDTLKLSIHL